MLAIEQQAGEHPAAKAITPAVLCALGNDKKRAFAKEVLDSTRLVSIFSPGGLYLGQRMSYYPKLNRLDRVATRVLKGMFYHELRRRLPDTHEATVWSVSRLSAMVDERSELRRPMCLELLASPRKTTPGNVLDYWFQTIPGDPNMSMWILQFYSGVAFVGVTLAKERVQI